MTLKEDYDYTASHISTHGSILRCNRLILRVKHSTNAGGAVSARDAAGQKEQQNIAILQRKWPGVFHLNGRRNHAVVMCWKHLNSSIEGERDPKLKSEGAKPKATTPIVAKAKTRDVPGDAMVCFTGQESKVAYITKRCKRAHGFVVADLLQRLTFSDKNGSTQQYGLQDLRYDLSRGFLKLSKGGASKTGKVMKRGSK